MAKMIKFALADDGQLVYRSTGRLANLGYHIKGGNRVYGENGRLKGYIGKPTATQRKTIEHGAKARKRAIRKREDLAFEQAIKGFGGNVLDPFAGIVDIGDKPYSFESASQVNQIVRGVPDIMEFSEISIDERRALNFSSALQAGVDAGVHTREEAEALFEAYMDDMTAHRYDKLREHWNKLNKFYDVKGFKYP